MRRLSGAVYLGTSLLSTDLFGIRSPAWRRVMNQRFFAASIAAALVSAHGVNASCCNAAEPYRSASESAYSSARPRTATVTTRMSFRDRILATYDTNGNGRLDGKEKLAARNEIAKYRSVARKYAYARQQYAQAVRTARTAYVQSAIRQRPTSFTLAPAPSRGYGGNCKDSRHMTVNFSGPAMKRVNGPPPSSAPGLIKMPVTKTRCCY